MNEQSITLKTPIGEMVATSTATHLIRLYFGKTSYNHKSQLINELESQMEAYFSGALKTFTIPLALSGTEFQCAVWHSLLNIPYGETCSYQEIAREIGHPKACRAVGSANKSNPILLLIPCHRVITSSGRIGGYIKGKEKKHFLLDLENKS